MIALMLLAFASNFLYGVQADEWEWLQNSNGDAFGDPHFRTLLDHRFSYHGECDLVLVHNQHLAAGADLRVHIRTEIRRSYSFVAGAAIQIGKEVFEITPQQYFFNGKVIRDLPTNFAGYEMKSVNSLEWCAKRNCTDTDMMQLHLGEDGSIQVARFKGFLYVQVSADEEGFQNSTGILGSTGRYGQFSRDGNRLLNDTIFAEEWQVLDTEPKLFRENRYPQYPEPCISPPATDLRRIIDENADLYKVAVHACSFAVAEDEDYCIYDVLATGDVDMAVPFTADTF